MSKLLAAVVITAFVLAGCNTVAGAGKDVEKTGQAVQGASKSVSDDLKSKQK